MASGSPLKSPLKWWGGKTQLAPWIVEQFPAHTHYVELFGGSLAVLFAKPLGASELVNDLNRGLSNFWRVLQRDGDFEQFRRRVEAAPFSRVEWDESHEPATDHIDAAVRFFVRMRQSRSGAGGCFASITRTRTRRGVNDNASAWLSAVDGLDAIYHRLRGVVVEDTDAVALIPREDTPGTLFYADPPYYPSSRSSPDVYACEMSEAHHERLLWALRSAVGRVVLSGYDCEQYADILTGWRKLTREVAKHGASVPKGETSKTRAVECLWLNY